MPRINLNYSQIRNQIHNYYQATVKQVCDRYSIKYPSESCTQEQNLSERSCLQSTTSLG